MSFVVMETDLSRLIRTAEAIDQYVDSNRSLIRASIIARSAIRSRSSRETSYTGKKFTPLTPAYVKRKGSAIANLRLSGHLMDNLTTKMNADQSATLSPAESDRGKAEGLTVGRGKRGNRRARPFMGITKEDDRAIEVAVDAELQSVIDNVRD